MSHTPGEIQRALGAGAPRPTHTRPHGPFGVMQLRAELAGQLRPPAGSAGPPSDQDRTISRLVGFRPETWRILSEIAAQASTPQQPVSPAQVAARLIEDGVERLGLEAEDGST